VAELLASDVEAASFGVLSRLVRERAASHAPPRRGACSRRSVGACLTSTCAGSSTKMRVLEFQLRTDTEPRTFIIADAVASVSA